MLARRAFPSGSWDTTGRLVPGAKMNNDGIAWVVGVIKVILGLSACRVGYIPYTTTGIVRLTTRDQATHVLAKLTRP